MPRTPATFGHVQALDAIVKDGLTDVYGDYPMGNWCVPLAQSSTSKTCSS